MWHLVELYLDDPDRDRLDPSLDSYVGEDLGELLPGSALPADDRLRLNEHDRRLPARPQLGEE